MTIAVIVACKNSFYIVTDTLMSDPSSKMFTLDNQKVFWSEKHKIGLCIAGQANLISKALDRDSINVSHVVRDFFAHIDNLDTIQLETLGIALENFVDRNYANYHNYFRFQTPGTGHDKDVSYFYGGFQNPHAADHDGSIVVIYSHHKGLETHGNCDSVVPYFSNYQREVEYYINFGLSFAPIDKPRDEYLKALLDQYKDYVLKHYIPQACIFVNTEHPYSIGKNLHCIVFVAERPVIHRSIRYDGQDVDTISAQETSPPHYSLYKTSAEAILANEAAYSSIDGHQVQRYILNSSAEVQRAKNTGLVSADHVESIVLPHNSSGVELIESGFYDKLGYWGVD